VVTDGSLDSTAKVTVTVKKKKKGGFGGFLDGWSFW